MEKRMITLRTIKPDSIRGLPRHWGNLDVGRRGLIICGENGTGKTSVLDALEYALKGTSTLFSNNRIGVKWELAAPHVRTGSPDVCAYISDGTKSYTVVPDSEISQFPEDISRWIEIARTSKFILRRHMLLDFIDTAPALRYTALEPFLAMDSYTEIEEALSQWIGDLDTQLDVIDSGIELIRGRVKSVFDLQEDESVPSMSAAIGSLNLKLAEAGLSPCENIDTLKKRENEINLALGGQSVTKPVEMLIDLKSQVSRLGLPSTLLPMLKALIDAKESFDTLVGQATKAVFVDFLVEARGLIHKHSLSVCPVCERPIDRLRLLARLKQRIEADRKIVTANAIVKSKKTALITPATLMLNAYQTYAIARKRIVPRTSLPLGYAKAMSFLVELKQILSSDNPTAEELRKCYKLVEGSVTDHRPVLQALDNALAKEGGASHRASLNAALQMIASIKKDIPDHSSQVICQTTIAKQVETIGRLYQHSVNARKTAVQRTFDSVASLANAMYEKLHPDEGIARSTLSVRETANASVVLMTDFHGQSENPLLHHSESHLDTLGLCYFLALRRRAADREPDFKLLVLDDVIYSVDAAHRSRFTGILGKYFSDHQVILTTHDQIFFHKLRQAFGGAEVEYRMFTNWSIERGPVCMDSTMDIDRVCCKEVRECKSPDELAGACGRFFEMFLRQITERLKISVVAKFETRYEINDLWPPTLSKLSKRKSFIAANESTIAKIDENRWVRNECGAHYNESATPPSPSEILDLAEGLAELYAVTHCEKCSQYVSRQTNGDWRCNCSDHGLIYPK
jgi:hypothetical protein